MKEEFNKNDNADSTSANNGELSRFRQRLTNANREVNKSFNIYNEESKTFLSVDDNLEKTIDVSKIVTISRGDDVKLDTRMSRLNKKINQSTKKIDEIEKLDKNNINNDLDNEKLKEKNKEDSKSLFSEEKEVLVDKANVKLDNVPNREEYVRKKRGVVNSRQDKIKKQQSKYVGIIKRKDVSSLSDLEKINRLDELQTKILWELNQKFERELDELKELSFENNEIIDDFREEKEVSLSQVKEREEKLQNILKRIQELIEQVKILNNNTRSFDILDLSEFKDQNIVNDIIEFRDILDVTSSSFKLNEKYKMLDNFIQLYRDAYSSKKVVEENVQKAKVVEEDTERRDENYSKMSSDLSYAKQTCEDCKLIIDKQNEYIYVLNKRINEITSNKVIEYRLRGVNELLTTTLLYIGIMVAMPFKNKNIAIGAKLLATGRMLRNLRLNRPRLEEVSRLRYEAEDFNNQIYMHLSEIEMAFNLIDVTMEDVQVMKAEFEKDFKGKVPGYEEVLEKLVEIEDMINSSKAQLLKAEEELKIDQKVNERKLNRVRELNEGTA